jgi:hypothetical protein
VVVLTLILVNQANICVDTINSILVGGTDVVSDELISIRDGLDGGGILVEDIDLLQRETLSLGDAEVGEDETANTSRTPDEEHLGTKVSELGVDDVGSRVTDNEVPEPVGRNREGHGLGTDGEREDFGGDYPSDGSPGSSKEGDVDADEGDEHLLASLVIDGDRNTNDGDKELADEHTNCTNEEESTTTNVINGPEGRDGHADVDDGGGNSDQEWIGDTRIFEEGRSVVEDEVDTGEGNVND